MNEGRDTSIYPSAQELRAWANSRQPGVIGPKGNLPRFVVLAWNKTHRERPFVQSESFHGTPQGYQQRGCRCDRCLESGRAYGRAIHAERQMDRDNDLADALLEESS